MNTVIIHGKVVQPGKMVMVNIKGIENTVAIFTVVDIGTPNKDEEPLFIQVNYRKFSADNLCKYLVKGKELLITGSLKLRYAAGKQIYFIEADEIVLLPLFKAANEGDAN